MRDKGTNMEDSTIVLTREDEQSLLSIARQYFKAYVLRTAPPRHVKTTSNTRNLHAGAFVTIKQKHGIRACMGSVFNETDPLYSIVGKVAHKVHQDSRLKRRPMSLQEIDDVRIEVTLIPELNLIKDPTDWIVGKHGIKVEEDKKFAAILPQFIDDKNLRKEEALGTVCERIGKNREAWRYPSETLKFHKFLTYTFSE